MNRSSDKRVHPLLWVPSLYLAMGTPNIAVTVVAAIMYKNLGVSNAEIAAYTAWFNLPWVLKPLWSPVVEMFRTKRFFVLCMEFALAATFAAIALSLKLPSHMVLTLALFWAAGFASATQDIAADGVYISSMTGKQQATYAGVQGVFWNLARILASGVLVSLTGYLHDSARVGWTTSWMIVMFIIAGFMAVAGIWHVRVLPPGYKAPADAVSLRFAVRTITDSLNSFFAKRQIGMMILVIFFYRFGEGFIEKMGPLFLLDKRAVGGLELSNTTLGNINGSFGTIGFIGGTFLGGLIAARYTLKRTFVPLALALNIPHVTYFYLSQVLPTDLVTITITVTIEKIGYGFGAVGLMLYMMQQLAPGKYTTAHYAFGTGIMAACMLVTGYLSGFIQPWLGHQAFFIFVLIASVPPVIIAWFAPFAVAPTDAGAALPATAHTDGE
jgi:PAT family beta-lactamase induction signal transducer AmpG